MQGQPPTWSSLTHDEVDLPRHLSLQEKARHREADRSDQSHTATMWLPGSVPCVKQRGLLGRVWPSSAGSHQGWLELCCGPQLLRGASGAVTALPELSWVNSQMQTPKLRWALCSERRRGSQGPSPFLGGETRVLERVRNSPGTWPVMWHGACV